ncbi:hypothetical protein BJF89_14960 [Corynebacterium sp. CNJ-954]|uniref:UPF0182 family protein n=1 Tax=Corynebacterium sp. CNJ-954 TaxID=1904962 RepID=UPI00096A01FA|nr:UPF0182 family protein [Corynebacterium sp. CNJ-954]OLT55589.1 hypothetical protein BJF89_14960 [Corynebacterium sp. CNJ-954]
MSIPEIPKPGRRSKILGTVAVVIALLFFLVPVLVSNYTELQWFRSIDFQAIFLSVLVTRVILFIVFGLVAAAIVWGACFAAFRAAPKESDFPDVSEIGLGGDDSPLTANRAEIRKAIRPFLIIVPLIAGVITGMIAQGNWRTVRLFLSGGDFGVKDPQFQMDLGFYAFTLPLLTFVLGTVSVLVIVAFLVNLLAHYLLGTISTGNPRAGEKARIGAPARRQLVIIAGIWMLLKAVDYWFQRYALLNNQHDTFTGGSYTDINAILPAKILLLVVSLFVAAMFFSSILLKDLRVPALAVGLMIVANLAIGVGWPAVMEQFSVNPNRAEKEREYIARNIESTRQAYGIETAKDSAREGYENPDGQVTYERNWGGQTSGDASERRSIADDDATLSNIRLLDPDVLSPTFTQQQQLRNFYGFPDELSVDRYEVDGDMRDFVVAAREIDPNALSGNQTDWINQHTVYTHGNGFIAAPANTVDEVAQDAASARGGYPIYTVADLQNMESDRKTGELDVEMEQPRIYFGPVIAGADAANADYAIVGDDGSGTPREYDTDNSEYTYTGEGGVGVSNIFHRALYAAKFQEMNILLSDVIGDDSKILYDRDPRERVHKVAPWLTTDSKTYPVVIDGRIKWVVDGYTTLENLPYSARTQLDSATEDALTEDPASEQRAVTNDVSYIRNSVKAVVDSYDGTVDLFEFDEEDPVLKAWEGVFPNVVKPKEEISDELMEHLRYPEDLFKVQRELIAKYHVDDPGTFFTNDAFWSVPGDPTAPEGGQELNQPPYHVVATDPETNRPGFQLITPFVGLRREFLAAHMTVSSDPDNYGRIYVRQLPTNTQTQGPKQAQDTMMSSDEIARERTLLEGTNTLTNGNLLTLPVGDGQILYVEPVYSQRADQESAFPKLLRVLVSYNGSVGYAPTVSEALEQVGIDPDAVTEIAESGGEAADENAAAAGEDSDSDSDSGSDSTSTSTPSSSAAETPGGGSGGGAEPSEDELSDIRDAMDRVNDARENGTFEEFGRALDDLDAAVKAAQ